MRAPLLVALVAALSVVVSTIPRALAAAGALPPPWIIFGWSDVLETWIDGRLAGHHVPYLDVAFAYPPVVGYVAGALSLLSDGYGTYVVGWAAVTALAAAIAAVALARHSGWRRALAYWALTPQLLLLSAINFDVLPATALALAAIAARRRRELASVAALAFGTATKLFPLVSAPLLPLRRVSAGDPRRAAKLAVAFGAFLVALYLPAAIAPHSALPFTASYAYGVAANIDSIWGLAHDASASLGLDLESWIVPLSLLGTAITYAVIVLPRAARTADPVVPFALATLVVLLWARLYSPQYSLWLLPFFVLLPLRATTFGFLSLADVAVFFTIYPLTLLPHSAAEAATIRALLAGAVLLRHAALLLLTRDCLVLARREAA